MNSWIFKNVQMINVNNGLSADYSACYLAYIKNIGQPHAIARFDSKQRSMWS